MMPSLRKKVAGFIRQLSVNNQSDNVTVDQNSSGAASGCFIQRYLSGHDVRQNEPVILHGRNPHELPRKSLGAIVVGSDSVYAAMTGPDGGLTTVNRKQRHLSTSDPDVDYIDILEQQAEQERNTGGAQQGVPVCPNLPPTNQPPAWVLTGGGGCVSVPPVSSSDCIFSRGYGRWFTIRPPVALPHPIDNSVMHIRAAGSVFSVGKRSVHTSVSDLQTFASEEYQMCESKSEDLTLSQCMVQGDEVCEMKSRYINKDMNLNLSSSSLELDNELFSRNTKGSQSHLDEADVLQASPEMNGNAEATMFHSALEEDLVIPPPAEYATPVGMTPIRKSKSAPSGRLEGQSGAAGRVEDVAGVANWSQPHDRVYGAATTLYERHPLTREHAGNPIADCFAVVARHNSAILALADGVNWGEKACVAARSAVHGCVEYLNKALFCAPATASSTTEVFVALLRSFHAAHGLILQEGGMLTTLTAAVVLPLAGPPGRYVVCVCNVGDSLAYVYSPVHGVREITKGSHDIHCMRDMRDALGALGPVDGQNPELNNLTCSMTEVESGDIVFLTSDGVSDNFDPVVGKFAVLPPAESGNTGAQALPTVQAFQRHELSLLRMDDLLRHGVSGTGEPCGDARALCELLLDFATRLTAAKRRILEDPELYCEVGAGGQVSELGRGEQRARRRRVCERLAMVPGKLDHATVTACVVGDWPKP